MSEPADSPMPLPPPAAPGSGAPGTPLRTYLARLFWIVLAPLLLAAVALAIDHVHDIRDGVEQEAQALARAASLSIDRAVRSRIQGLSMIAESSRAADPARRAELYELAQAFRTAFGVHLVVADAASQMLINTRVPLDTPLPLLPTSSGRSAVPIALRTGQPAVGDVVLGPVVQEPLVALAVPIRRGGQSLGVVLGTLDAAFLRQRLTELPLAEGWSVTLRDSTGRPIAGTGVPSLAPGGPSKASARAASSALTGWSVHVEIADDVAEAPVRTAALGVAMAVLLTVAFSVVVGSFGGRRLEAAVGTLLREGPSAADRADLREVAAVRRRLDEVAMARRHAEDELRDREETLRLFIEHAPVMLAMFDREMRYLVTSRRFSAAFNPGGQALQGRSHYEVVPGVTEAWKDAYRRGMAGEVVRVEEEAVQRADGGGTRWVRWEVRPWLRAGGREVGGILLLIEDITARKEVEAKLATQRRQLDAALANMLDAVYIADARGRFVEVNEAFRRLFRRTAGEDFVRSTTQFRDLIEVFDLDGRPLPFERWPAPAALRGVSGRDVTLIVRFKGSGERFYASFTSSPLLDADGTVIGAVVTARDVTARVEVERALRESERDFRELAEQVPAIVYRASVEPGRPALYVSPHIGSLGYSAAEWTSTGGPNWHHALHPGDRPRVLEALGRLREVGQELVLEYRLRDRWLGWRDFIDHGRIVEGRAGGPRVFQGVMLEITQLKRTERALLEAEAYQRSLFESQPDGVLLLDGAQRVLDANPAAVRLLACAREQLLGRDLRDFVLPGDHARMLEVLTAPGGGPRGARAAQQNEWEQVRADGSRFPAEVSVSAGADGSTLVVLRDMSERHAAERALQAYRMELSELTRRLLTQERETTRHVAQSLHDHLGQSLAGARLRLDAAAVQLADTLPPLVRQACAQVGVALDAAMGDVRSVLGELRPPMLEDQGLVAALDNEIRVRTLAAGSVDVLLEVDEGRLAARWPADVEYAAFMIAREAIFNAQLHAEATLVRVIVDGGEGALAVDVVDDGSGIPPELRSGRPGHLGIVGMRERAAAIGARFAVEQPAEGGTCVRLRWPGDGA